MDKDEWDKIKNSKKTRGKRTIKYWAGTKIGNYNPTHKRNKPCPCGSGKKYKKCHGA